MATINIDLSKMFVIENVSIFLEFDGSQYKNSMEIPEVAERLLNSCSFASKIEVEEDKRLRCGLVRASISELVSLEELSVIKERNDNKPFFLNSTGHPLLCVVKELRNQQLHLSSVKMESYKRNMLWGRIDQPEEAAPIIKDIVFINNLEFAEFSKLHNYKNYNPSELEMAIDWFDSQQKEWGITELLIQAAYSYAELVSSLFDKERT